MIGLDASGTTISRVSKLSIFDNSPSLPSWAYIAVEAPVGPSFLECLLPCALRHRSVCNSSTLTHIKRPPPRPSVCVCRSEYLMRLLRAAAPKKRRHEVGYRFNACTHALGKSSVMSSPRQGCDVSMSLSLPKTFGLFGTTMGLCFLSHTLSCLLGTTKASKAVIMTRRGGGGLLF